MPRRFGRLCQMIRWTPRKTARHARQREEAANHALVSRDRARPSKTAQAGQQRIFFIDKCGLYPLPSVVHTYGSVGRMAMVRGWWSYDHLGAVSTRRGYCHNARAPQRPKSNNVRNQKFLQNPCFRNLSLRYFQQVCIPGFCRIFR